MKEADIIDRIWQRSNIIKRRFQDRFWIKRSWILSQNTTFSSKTWDVRQGQGGSQGEQGTERQNIEGGEDCCGEEDSAVDIAADSRDLTRRG